MYKIAVTPHPETAGVYVLAESRDALQGITRMLLDRGVTAIYVDDGCGTFCPLSDYRAISASRFLPPARRPPRLRARTCTPRSWCGRSTACPGSGRRGFWYSPRPRYPSDSGPLRKPRCRTGSPLRPIAMLVAGHAAGMMASLVSADCGGGKCPEVAPWRHNRPGRGIIGWDIFRSRLLRCLRHQGRNR